MSISAGLVRFWAKDIKVGFANINAKAEGIENKPAFREAIRVRSGRKRSRVGKVVSAAPAIAPENAAVAPG